MDVEKEKETAESVRKRSMESLGETMCREKEVENEGKRKIVSDETVIYIKREKWRMNGDVRRLS